MAFLHDHLGRKAVMENIAYFDTYARDLPADQAFSGDKIDLGGFNYLATFNIRF